MASCSEKDNNATNMDIFYSCIIPSKRPQKEPWIVPYFENAHKNYASVRNSFNILVASTCSVLSEDIFCYKVPVLVAPKANFCEFYNLI